MVKHIVMFKLAEKNPDNMAKAVNALKGMDGKIETLRYLEVGTDYNGYERSFDIVLVTHFESREGLKVYETHKNHEPVRNIMRSLSSTSAVVDYEV